MTWVCRFCGRDLNFVSFFREYLLVPPCCLALINDRERQMTDPRLMRASVSPISPLITEEYMQDRALIEALPARRLAEDDRLNTWLFNMRLSCSWAWTSSYEWTYNELPFPVSMMNRGVASMFFDSILSRRKQKRGTPRDKEWHHLDRLKRRVAVFISDLHIKQKRREFYWRWIATEIECQEVLDPSTLIDPKIIRDLMDPARDTRKLRDETTALWHKKREAQRLILLRDHHLFIYLETAAFFWELTGEDDIDRRRVDQEGLPPNSD